LITKFDGAITNLSIDDMRWDYGKLILVRVNFSITPIYNTLFNYYDLDLNDTGMLTLSWLAENYSQIFGTFQKQNIV